MLGHQAHGTRVTGDLDDRHDRVADDVALAGREDVHHIARGGLQRAALGGGRRGVHEVETLAARRRLGGLQHIDELHLLADLLEVAERLLLDGGEAAGDVALGGLALGEVGGLVRLDDVVLVGLPGLHELLAHLGRRGARRGEMLGAREFGGLAEAAVETVRDQLVVHVADGGAGGEAGGGVALAALGRDPQLADVALDAHLAGGLVDEFLGLARCGGHGGDVAVALDPEAGDRLPGLRDAVDDALRPARLDADDDAGGDVRVGAGADHRAEVQVEVGAELQAPVGVRQRDRALDVVGDGLAGGVRDVVDRQDGDIVADAHAAVLAAEGPDLAVVMAHVRLTNAWS